MLAEQTAPHGRPADRPFTDGFGRRYKSAPRDTSDVVLEVLCFRHEITDVPAFEFALRERVARLSQFHHPDFTHIKKVDRLNDERGTVALMSDGVKGFRLSEILTDTERLAPPPDVGATLYVVNQLTAAIAVLHDQARVAHGALGPERIFITPLARVCIVEHAMGAAVEQLKYSREKYWKELRVALPESAGLPRADERADVTQLGIVALSLLLGRLLRADEYPAQLATLVATATASTPSVGDWLKRALQLDPRGSFRTAAEAQTALEQVIRADGFIRADARSLEAFLQRYRDWMEPPAAAAAKSLALSDGLTRFDSTVTLAPLDLPAETTAVPLFEEVEAPRAEEHPVPKAPSKSDRGGRIKWMAAAIVLALLATGGVFAARQFASKPAAVTAGTITVNTNPPGVELQVDGVPRGRTPVTLSVEGGTHTLAVLGADGQWRKVPVTVAAGAQVSHHLELPKATAALGQLSVRTEPAGARISIDGTPLGKTPMTIVELAPGEHTVTLESDAGTVNQKVMIEAGMSASLMVPLAGAPGAGMASGWISVTAPVVMDLYEGGRLLGSTGIDRIMLPAGRHEIEVVNEAIGFRETRTTNVQSGRVSTFGVTLPKGIVSINAVPWATVSIDGEPIGDTPIGNLPLTIGPHEVVFRNAQLGEQRRVITVTTRGPVRLSVDMAKK
jgi:hypothetical protein